MNKIKFLSVGVGVLLILNFALLFILTQKPGRPLIGRPHHDPDKPKRIIIKRLQFDQEQIAKYQVLIDGHRRSVRDMEEQISKAKNALYLTLADEKQMGKDSLENRLGALQRQMEEIHYNHFDDIRKLCHPYQIPFYKQLTQELAFFFAPDKKGHHPPKE